MRTRHNKAVLLAAGFDVDMKILPRPVLAYDGIDGDVFFF